MQTILDPVELSKIIININTINPPGNESELAFFLGNILKINGFKSIIEEAEFSGIKILKLSMNKYPDAE